MHAWQTNIKRIISCIHEDTKYSIVGDKKIPNFIFIVVIITNVD